MVHRFWDIPQIKYCAIKGQTVSRYNPEEKYTDDLIHLSWKYLIGYVLCKTGRSKLISSQEKWTKEPRPLSRTSQGRKSHSKELLSPLFLIETLSFVLCGPVFYCFLFDPSESILWLPTSGWALSKPVLLQGISVLPLNLWLACLLKNLFGNRRHIEQCKDPLYFILS